MRRMETSNSINEVEKEKKSILSCYALYAYSLSKVDHIKKPTTEDCSVNQELDSEVNFCLSILATNLDAQQETSLRTFLCKRLSKGMLIEGPANGNVSDMDFCLGEETTTKAVCYSSLLSNANLESGGVTDDGFECLESSPQLYIICLLTVANGILDFFKPELISFQENLIPLLDPGLSRNLEAVKDYLDDWYDVTLGYICRCVSILKMDVHKLLQLALSNGKLTVSAENPDLEADFLKFYESCSLSGYLTGRHIKTENSAAIELKINKNNFEIRYDNLNSCNEFCKSLAMKLVENNDRNPLILRKIIEDFKLKAIQDINLLKRMIQLAQNDYYILYRTYTFLQRSGYGNLLLQHAKLEASTNKICDSLSVISVIEDFL